MTEKKVLIITYYWPPSGGSGVQRWLKFVKYLPSYGWTPYVFTPENPAFGIKDESLLKDVPLEAEVVLFPIWEPYAIFQKLSRLVSGKDQEMKPTALVATKDRSLFQKLSTWIRGNLFIPDPRVFWVRPASRFLEDFVKDQGIRTVITTGPPHSVHLIGLRLKRTLSYIHWIADFRDPWSQWGFLDSLNVGGLARARHRRLESEVLHAANEVVTITPFYVKQFKRLANRSVTLLTNGYDPDDFEGFAPVQTTQFVIRHVGIVNEKCDPVPFLNSVEMLLASDPNRFQQMRIEFVGEVHPRVQDAARVLPHVQPIIHFLPGVPHNELMRLYAASNLLLLVLTGYKDAAGYMPGKLFEYLATGLPVLATGPVDGDAAHLLQSTKAGIMIDSADTEGIAIQIKSRYFEWETGSRKSQRGSYSEYSRKNVTGKLVELLKP